MGINNQAIDMGINNQPPATTTNKDNAAHHDKHPTADDVLVDCVPAMNYDIALDACSNELAKLVDTFWAALATTKKKAESTSTDELGKAQKESTLELFAVQSQLERAEMNLNNLTLIKDKCSKNLASNNEEIQKLNQENKELLEKLEAQDKKYTYEKETQDKKCTYEKEALETDIKALQEMIDNVKKTSHEKLQYWKKKSRMATTNCQEFFQVQECKDQSFKCGNDLRECLLVLEQTAEKA